MAKRNGTRFLPILLAITLFPLMAGCTSEPSGGNGTAGHEHREELYQCPMHPQITADKPGTCPICGMDLVKVEPAAKDGMQQKKTGSGTEQEMSGSGTENTAANRPEGRAPVRLTLAKQQLIGVKWGEAKIRRLRKVINAPGRIAFDPELYTAQSEYLEALGQWRRVRNSPLADVRKSTREMIRSAKVRLKVLGLSNSQIEALEKRGRISESLLLSQKGEKSWVYADLFEMDAPLVEKGFRAEITAAFLQGRTLEGTVTSVDQVINPKTRTAKARIELNASKQVIRPESYVNARIFVPLGEQLSVPLDAILNTGQETYVFVRRSPTEIEPRVVRVRFETEKYAAIAGGLSPGDEVVLGANFLIDSESRLRGVLQEVTDKKTDNDSGHNH